MAELAGLKVYHLAIRGVVEVPIRLPEDQPGMALRGAFFNSLWSRFCNNKEAASCGECPLHQGCPVSALVAPLRDENPRGRDVPRPYGIKPPQKGGNLLSGEEFEFGLTLFGKVLPLMPYVVMAAQGMGKNGVGSRTGQGQRGRFQVTGVEGVNLLSGQRQSLLDARKQVSFPRLVVGVEDVRQRAESLGKDNLEVEFVTPLRLVDKGELVRKPLLRPLLQRLFERLTALNREYGEDAGERENNFRELLAQAETVELVENFTEWREIASYSTRQGRCTPIGGLVGRARYQGQLGELLPWLVWGEATQAGKDTVKGNGWYKLISG